jgi:hypothetical protein
LINSFYIKSFSLFYYFDSFGWISILWAIMKTAVVELVMVSNRRHRLDLNGIYPNRYVLWSNKAIEMVFIDNFNHNFIDFVSIESPIAQCILQDVDLRLYRNDLYGKGFMKKCKVSPDAYIQMALQLAYYRVSIN